MPGPRTEGLVKSLCFLRRKASSVAPKAPAAMLDARAALKERFERARTLSLGLVHGLSDADARGQSTADASPSKWRPAHTAWFFETFVLRDFVRKVWRNRRYFASILIGE